MTPDKDLRTSLEASHAAAESLRQPSFPTDRFERLQAWQRRRLARTYRDFSARPQYHGAVQFFLEQVYGGDGFRERDRQVEQVLPVMVRLMPPPMLSALARAFELQALSINLDAQMARTMLQVGALKLDDAHYARLYRATARDQRERQIALIHALGMALNRLVHRRSVLALVSAMRVPARTAGFGVLQNFLEQGLQAFRAIGDARDFVDTIRARETAFIQGIYATGDAPPDN